MTQITLNAVEAESGAVGYNGDEYLYTPPFGSGSPPSLTTGLPAAKIAFFAFDISEATTGKTPAQIAAALTAGCSLKFNLPTAIHSGEGVEVGILPWSDMPYNAGDAEMVFRAVSQIVFTGGDAGLASITGGLGDKTISLSTPIYSPATIITIPSPALIVVLTNIAGDAIAHEFRRHSVGHVQLLLGAVELSAVELSIVQTTSDTTTQEIKKEETTFSIPGDKEAVIYHIVEEWEIFGDKNGVYLNSENTGRLRKNGNLKSISKNKLEIILKSNTAYKIRYKIRSGGNWGAWSSITHFRTRNKDYKYTREE